MFTEEWSSAKLLSRVNINHDTRVLTFELPDSTKPLNLPTCACILAKGGKGEDGEPVVRPYTPVSTNAMVGKFELMVKVYEKGLLSQYLDKVPVGEEVEFKHISFNVKLQYPFVKKNLGMLVGGTGITPMVQALHAILGTDSDDTKVSMLYGSRSQSDIICNDTLQDWGKAFPGRLAVEHVLSHEPDGSDWSGSRGFIGRELIEKSFAPPGDDVLIFICGPPPMYEALCGPRGEKEVGGLLKEMGYTDEMVYKF